jgi:pimeloyl-ACP methyl ester carboxylesterase
VLGRGATVVLSGRPGFSASLVRDEAELLADRVAVHLIDPHGSGGSTPPTAPAQSDHVGHARFYDAVRRALGLERVSIMGISFGSLVA